MPVPPNPQPDTNWTKIYLMVLLINAILISAFYFLGSHFNLG